MKNMKVYATVAVMALALAVSACKEKDETKVETTASATDGAAVAQAFKVIQRAYQDHRLVNEMAPAIGDLVQNEMVKKELDNLRALTGTNTFALRPATFAEGVPATCAAGDTENCANWFVVEMKPDLVGFVDTSLDKANGPEMGAFRYDEARQQAFYLAELVNIPSAEEIAEMAKKAMEATPEQK